MLNYFSKKIYILVIILLILILAGIFIAGKLSVGIFPDLNYPLLNIVTHYSGASPKDMELLITKPIENQLSGLINVRRISSISRMDLSQVTVEFDWGVSVRDARQMVGQALSMVNSELPRGAAPVIENLGTTLQEIMQFGVTPGNSGIDSGELKYIVRTKFANHLRSIKGVSRVNVIGGTSQAFIVLPLIKSLLQYKLTLSEIKEIIKANNFQVMAGYTEKGSKDYAIRGLGNIKRIEELKNIVVKKIKGIPVLLKNISKVKTGYLPRRYSVLLNGKPGIVLSIFKNSDESTLKVADEVNKRAGEILKSLPYGIKIKKIYDQSELINEAVNNIRNNIILGGLLVILILFLFLGRKRDALLIAFSIPVIIIISFIFFPVLNLSLNMITLGAIAVVIGMIVDDSIIVIENISRHSESGKQLFQAVIDGTKEILWADVSGTLTTVAAFIPFVFLSGLAGIFTASFGFVVITTLLISLLLSISIIPLLIAGGIKRETKMPVGERFIKKFSEINEKLLKKFLNHKKSVIIATLFLLLLSSGLLIFSPVSFLPQVDEGAILLEYILPPGTSFNESNRIGKMLGAMSLDEPDVETVYRRTGSKQGTYQIEPVNRGELVIKLVPRRKRKHQIFKIINSLKKRTEEIPGAIMMFHQVTSEKLDESFSGLPTLFGVRIFGEDYNKLIKYAGEVEEIATDIKGVESIINITKYRVPELRIETKPEGMAHYGFSSKEIMEEFKLFLRGEIISKIVKKEKYIPIFLKSDIDSRSGNEIERLPLRTGSGYIPASEVIKTSIVSGANSITHINLQREITLPMEIDGAVSEIVNQFKERIKDLDLQNGYTVEFGGQHKIYVEMFKKVVFFSLLSLLIIFLIISIQFGNYFHPIAILVEIPFSLIGAFLAIAISRQPLNLSFFIGIITLIGVSVNNGIVLIDYTNKLRKQGFSIIEALYKATRIRTRPILLTALTSILALLPISLGIGIGSKIHQSLAIAVIGGLLLNTILTLNVLPVIYYAIENLFKKVKIKA